MCIQYVPSSIYSIYTYTPRPSNVKLGRRSIFKRNDRSLHKGPECTKSTGAVLVVNHGVFTAMNLDLDMSIHTWTDLTLRCWSSPSIWQEISVTQLQWFHVFHVSGRSQYRGQSGRGLGKPEVPPSPFAYGGSSCISAYQEVTGTTGQNRPQTLTQKSFFLCMKVTFRCGEFNLGNLFKNHPSNYQ